MPNYLKFRLLSSVFPVFCFKPINIVSKVFSVLAGIVISKTFLR